MKNKKISGLISLLILPAVLVILGLILLIYPDSASALVSKVIGWALIAAGAISGIVTLTGWPNKKVSRLVTTIVLLVLGSYLINNPLSLAANLGKLMGIVLVIQGVKNLLESLKLKSDCSSYKGKLILAAVTLIFGVFLVVNPMTTSRLLFRLVGLVLVVVGGLNLLSRLKEPLALEDPSVPEIVDAEE